MGNNECTIITLESSKEGDNITFSNSIEVFKEKPVRLFGFEINPSGASELSSSGGSSSGGDESPNTSKDAITSKRLKVGNKSSNKKFKCQSCLKAFGSSQALGGHQNAHKKQKTMKISNKKKIQAAKKTQHEHDGVANNYTSSWCFDQCISQSQINFSSSSDDPPIWCTLVKGAKKTNDQDPKTTTTTTTRVFTLTTSSDHNKNDLNLVDSTTKSLNKLLDLQLGLSLHSNLIYS